MKKQTRLTILGEGKRNKWNQKTYRCKCICGTIKDILCHDVNSGHVQSCGCLVKEKSKINLLKYITKHNFCGTRFYRIWQAINERCKRIKADNYKYYGGRGIKVIWKDFISFKKDMYKSYLIHVKKYGEKNTTIERKNNNDNYSKENCTWATMKEQSVNKRNNKIKHA